MGGWASKISGVSSLVRGTFQSNSLGVSHGDDCLNLFNLVPLDTDYVDLVPRSPDDVKFQRRVVDLWANFATYRRPVPTKAQLQAGAASEFVSDLAELEATWSKVDEKHSYARLKTDGIVQEKEASLEERMAFWQKLVQ